jgi:putative endonuclease
LQHLQAAGLRLLQRNYRTPGRGGGEIDLILRARDGTLVFVEVRQRRAGGHGGAAASVGAAKQARIVLAARHYLMRWPSRRPAASMWSRSRARPRACCIGCRPPSTPLDPSPDPGFVPSGGRSAGVSSAPMLEQRIQQHFIDSADLKYQAAQILGKPISDAVQAVMAA